MPGAISVDEMMSMPGAIAADEMSTPYSPTLFNEDDEAMVSDLSQCQGNVNLSSDDDEMAIAQDLFVPDAAGQHAPDEAQTPQPSESQVSLGSQKRYGDDTEQSGGSKVHFSYLHVLLILPMFQAEAYLPDKCHHREVDFSMDLREQLYGKEASVSRLKTKMRTQGRVRI